MQTVCKCTFTLRFIREFVEKFTLSFNRIPLAFRGSMLLLLIVAVLHTLDRQGEFVSRTDFLWKAKLKVEQEEVETMRGINKVNFFTQIYKDEFYFHTQNINFLLISP